MLDDVEEGGGDRTPRSFDDEDCAIGTFMHASWMMMMMMIWVLGKT
jgi:hypothetical protein